MHELKQADQSVVERCLCFILGVDILTLTGDAIEIFQIFFLTKATMLGQCFDEEVLQTFCNISVANKLTVDMLLATIRSS